MWRVHPESSLLPVDVAAQAVEREKCCVPCTASPGEKQRLEKPPLEQLFVLYSHSQPL